jgi:MFS family permease
MKLNVKRTILVGFAFLMISMFWQVYDNLVVKMLVDSFGLNQTMSGFVMAIDNILAIFLLPLFGLWSDKTMTKFGKRTPYIFIGTIIAALLITGVSIFDFYQQQAVMQNGISGVTSFLNNGVTNYAYSIDGVVAFTAEKMDVVSAHRAQTILNSITLQDPTMFIFFVVILFFVLFAMAAFRTPAVSLMPDVTPKPLRSKANALINLMGVVGGVISLLSMTFTANENSALFDQFGYIPAMLLLAILMIVMLSVFMTTVKENKWVDEMEKFSIEHKLTTREEIEQDKAATSHKLPKDVQRSLILILTSVVLWFMAYNAATTKYSIYVTNTLGQSNFTLPLMVANVTAAISFIPIGILATKFGRRKTILVGIGILTLALLIGIVVTPETSFLMFATMGLAGVGWATINVNSYPMVVEMSKGSNVGVYTGYYYTASMAAQIVTPILSGLLMDLFIQYVPTFGTRILFVYSAVFSVLAFIPMFFVKHGEPKLLEGEKVELHIDND